MTSYLRWVDSHQPRPGTARFRAQWAHEYLESAQKALVSAADYDCSAAAYERRAIAEATVAIALVLTGVDREIEARAKFVAKRDRKRRKKAEAS